MCVHSLSCGFYRTFMCFVVGYSSRKLREIAAVDDVKSCLDRLIKLLWCRTLAHTYDTNQDPRGLQRIITPHHRDSTKVSLLREINALAPCVSAAGEKLKYLSFQFAS